ncbi:MAG TPA: addiction module protein [Bacteroidia bacterium]|jgi:putative addiction module component (TIGR02574 family)|nr:addiction module protein [Bacteroidia bacterium]
MRRISVEKSIKDILNCSTAEKLLAVEEIWDNIRKEAFLEKPEEIKLVNERVAEYEKNPKKVKSWDLIKKNYLKKR